MKKWQLKITAKIISSIEDPLIIRAILNVNFFLKRLCRARRTPTDAPHWELVRVRGMSFRAGAGSTDG